MGFFNDISKINIIYIFLLYIIKISCNSKSLIKLNKISEITIKTKCSGNCTIISSSYSGILPNYFIYQGISQNFTNDYINLNPGINEITFVWNEEITSCQNMFYCTNIIEADLSKFNMSLITDSSYMFYACSFLTSINLNNVNASSLHNMDNMFRCCHTLKLLNLKTLGFIIN